VLLRGGGLLSPLPAHKAAPLPMLKRILTPLSQAERCVHAACNAEHPCALPCRTGDQLRWSNRKRRKRNSPCACTILLCFALSHCLEYFALRQEAVSERKKEVAVWLREGLVRLGPTFIKIGQQFSTRVDVLSPEFVKELEKLQVGGRGVRGCPR